MSFLTLDLLRLAIKSLAAFPLDVGRKLIYIRRSEDVQGVFWMSYPLNSGSVSRGL